MPPASAPTIAATEQMLVNVAVTSARRPSGALMRASRGQAGAVSAETDPFAMLAMSSTGYVSEPRAAIIASVSDITIFGDLGDRLHGARVAPGRQLPDDRREHERGGCVGTEHEDREDDRTRLVVGDERHRDGDHRRAERREAEREDQPSHRGGAHDRLAVGVEALVGDLRRGRAHVRISARGREHLKYRARDADRQRGRRCGTSRRTLSAMTGGASMALDARARSGPPE